MADIQDEYKNYCTKFNMAYKFMCQRSKNKEQIAKEVCQLRGYTDRSMQTTLVKSGLIFIEDSSCLDRLKDSEFSDLALYTDDNKFRLESRYILPVKDMIGNVIALIGWIPGNEKTKYVTTPSKFFSKKTLFYGLEQLGNVGIGKNFFICEGIFDSLSLRNLGFNAISQMGIVTSREKIVMYSLFKRLIGVPDKDAQGIKVVQSDTWSLPTNGSYLEWKGIDSKDIDSLISIIEEDSMREVLSDVWKNRSRVITLEV